VRRLALLLAGFGLARLFFWRKPEAPPSLPQPEPEADPRAQALRAKLAESREVVGEREEFERAETPVDEADLDERRKRVHDAARAAVEEMRGSSPGGDAGVSEP
jgi:hypothetical protein